MESDRCSAQGTTGITNVQSGSQYDALQSVFSGSGNPEKPSSLVEGIAGRLDTSTVATLIVCFASQNRYFVLLLADMAVGMRSVAPEKNNMST